MRAVLPARVFFILAPVLIVMVGAAFRGALWLYGGPFQGAPLHHDEALYGAWARLIATGRDPFLLTVWVDKPPLTLYLLAGSLRLFGNSEMALRLPGSIAGLLLIPTVYGLAHSAYGKKEALVAAGLIALSPFAIAFSPTAFTDGWLTLWLVAAAWAALARRSFAAGLLLGLAVASKQQGVLGISLVLGLMAASLREPRSVAAYLRMLGLAVLGFAFILAPLIWWDSLRWHNRPSFWDRSLQTYGGLAVAPLADWPTRTWQWVRQLGQFWGFAVASGMAWAGTLAAGVSAFGRSRRARRWGVDTVIFAYLIGYLALHIIITFQPWDRYLLPLTPIVSLLLARGIGQVTARIALARLRRASALLGVLGIALLLYKAGLAARGALPIGSNAGSYREVAAAATFLGGLDPTTIIYYRSLGWHLDYYLFEAPQERRWYGDAAKLTRDADATAQDEPQRTQWLILPGWELNTLPDLQAALASADLRLALSAAVRDAGGRTSVALYRILPSLQDAGISEARTSEARTSEARTSEARTSEPRTPEPGAP